VVPRNTTISTPKVIILTNCCNTSKRCILHTVSLCLSGDSHINTGYLFKQNYPIGHYNAEGPRFLWSRNWRSFVYNLHNCQALKTVLCLRRLDAGLSIGRPEVNSGTFCVGFVVDKVAPCQVSPPSISVFPSQYRATNVPYSPLS
jgi:hypothetical protein